MKTFKQYLTEQTNKPMKSVHDFEDDHIWDVRKSFMPIWYEFLVEEGLRKEGAGAFYALPEKGNAMEEKAFELASIEHPCTEYSRGLSTFKVWCNKHSPVAMLDAAIKEVFEKFYICFITVPRQGSGERDFLIDIFSRSKVFEAKHNVVWTNPFSGGSISAWTGGWTFSLFEDFCRNRNITEFTEYKKYDLDPETQEQWEDVAHGL